MLPETYNVARDFDHQLSNILFSFFFLNRIVSEMTMFICLKTEIFFFLGKKRGSTFKFTIMTDPAFHWTEN